MNVLQQAKEILFPNVESILRNFNKTQTRLIKLAERNRAKSAQLGDKLEAISIQRTELVGEALRADRIASKINSLIN